MNLVGKTREQIDHATRNSSREELVDLLYVHATLDPKFTVTQVARANGRMSRDAVLAKIRNDEIPREHVHLIKDNTYAIALSGLKKWDRKTALKLQSNGSA